MQAVTSQRTETRFVRGLLDADTKSVLLGSQCWKSAEITLEMVLVLKAVNDVPWCALDVVVAGLGIDNGKGGRGERWFYLEDTFEFRENMGRKRVMDASGKRGDGRDWGKDGGREAGTFGAAVILPGCPRLSSPPSRTRSVAAGSLPTPISATIRLVTLVN